MQHIEQINQLKWSNVFCQITRLWLRFQSCDLELLEYSTHDAIIIIQ